MSAFAALFALLLVGHYVGDYAVQTDWMATLKVAGATYPEGHPDAGQPAPAWRSWWWNQAHVATGYYGLPATEIADPHLAELWATAARIFNEQLRPVLEEIERFLDDEAEDAEG